MTRKALRMRRRPSLLRLSLVSAPSCHTSSVSPLTCDFVPACL